VLCSCRDALVFAEKLGGFVDITERAMDYRSGNVKDDAGNRDYAAPRSIVRRNRKQNQEGGYGVERSRYVNGLRKAAGPVPASQRRRY
jgi:hypothetical protein